jgi:hypothetical protein
LRLCSHICSCWAARAVHDERDMHIVCDIMLVVKKIATSRKHQINLFM